MYKNIKTILLCLLALFHLPAAHAAHCDENGGLKFLGASAGGGHSVWLSSTSAGAFKLESAAGGVTVDSWDKNKRGLRLSLSPFVSNGNGGTHKLYTNSNCLLDTQNQKGGFVFSPNLIPPGVTRPRPPPTDPFQPITPSRPTIPNMPGGVTPPIGVLPVEPLTPGMPGGVTPPIATIPTQPLTPGIPGGVTPPIAIIPAQPLTPGIPGGVTPPIATIPTQPLTPGIPGGMTPPIAIIPAQPLTPGMPGGVTPPIATLPGTTDPGEKRGVERSGSVINSRYAAPLSCPAGRVPTVNASGQTSDCLAPVESDIPLTQGRELLVASEWNVWADTNASHLSDQRHNMNTHGNTTSLSMGIDRLVTPDLVIGAQASLTRSNSNSFDGDMQADTNGFLIGPYLSYRVSPNWYVYGALLVGQQTIDQEILSLSGTLRTNQYSLNLQSEGQYAWEKAFLRPKVQMSYTYTSGDSYRLSGNVLSAPISLRMRSEGFGYGVIQPSLEINQTFDMGNNTLVTPYAEAGVFYEFDRPNSGQILTGNLHYTDASPWGGILRAGARSQINRSTILKLEVAYQSIGVNDLSVWGGQLFLSHSF